MKLLSMPCLLTVILILTVSLAHSEVKLPKLFSSHMVLQRETPLHIWGEAAPGEQVAFTLVGDLSMASGQSNMEIPLNGYNPATQIQDSTTEIAGANHPQIRLFLVQHDVSDYPLEDVKAVAGWSQCSPESAANFSAVAYFFARALQQKQHVAIGLIDATWGGTPAEAWTSLDTLGNDPSLMPVSRLVPTGWIVK
jgi:sialate O-acetylesterase